jgi:pimeloyl-ACP methyl ester carboxylesterase
LLGDDGVRQAMIRTVRGVGVRFLPEISIDPEPNEEEPRALQLDASARPALPPQQVRFCQTRDGTGLAYSVVGSGPPLVKTANWLNHLEYEWESPIWRHWLHELTERHTLLRYDERGNGLSDWKVKDLSLEAFVEDLETVVDAAEFDSFDLFGISQGCAVSIAYAVRHPDRVRRMVLYGGYSMGWALREDPQELAFREVMLAAIETGWGRNNPAFRQLFTSLYFPDASQEEAQWFNEMQRVSASPEGAKALSLAVGRLDVRHLLEKVTVPTMVVHCRDDGVIPVKASRYIAAKIPDARYVELDSSNHLILESEAAWPRLVQHLRAFLG